MFLTLVNTFSVLFSEKYFFLFDIPPFHLDVVIILIISDLPMVELWVEYGWNYMKFHPNSTTNSTAPNTLTLNVITPPWWKSGITNDKKYFSWKRTEKL